jgi:hypothetical protein
MLGAQGQLQRLDEITFVRRQRARVEMPPVAQVDAPGLPGREFLRAVDLPRELFEPGKELQVDPRRDPAFAIRLRGGASIPAS